MSGLSIVSSGENLSEWNEADMMKLRQQVSIFLSSKQNGGTSSHQINGEHGGKPGRTPNNTPEHHGVCDSSSCGKATGAKKTVSFAEKVCVHVRETGPPTDAANDRALLYTPPNSPNVSTNLGTQRAYQVHNFIVGSLFDIDHIHSYNIEILIQDRYYKGARSDIIHYH